MAQGLGNVVNPFLRGQYAAQASNQQADESQLQGLARLLQMQQSASDHPLKQDLLRAQVADAQARPEDRRLQMENVRATNMARISQQADQFERNMQLKLRGITNAEEKAAWDREYQQGRLALEGAARQQGAERLFYDTGIRSPVPQVGMAPGSSSGEPVPQGVGLESLLQGRPPMEQAAIRSAAGNTPSNLSVTPQGLVPGPGHGVAPTAPASAPAPSAGAVVPSSSPDTTATLSMGQSGGLEGRFAPVGGQPVPAAPAGASIPKPPEYAQWPQGKKDAYDFNASLAAGKANMKADVKANVNFAGGRESQMLGRVITGGNQVAAALNNIVKLPIESSAGIFGSRGEQKGIMNAGMETLVQSMTTQDVQTYNILTTGIQRSLAAIETSGLAPSGSLTHQMDAVKWKEGWSNYTKLLALSETRQIVEKGMEVILANPRVDPETKKLVTKIVDDVKTAVPWTNSDLIELQQKGRVNPGVTLQDVVKEKQKGTGGWSVVR